MKPKSSVFAFVSPLLVTVSLFFASAASAQTEEASNPAGAPPKVLNIVYQGLLPGKESAYASTLEKIARFYVHANIPVYWLEAASATGDSRMMSLNFFGSFAAMDMTVLNLNNALEAHADLATMQESLLTNISSNTNAFAVRRDDIGYRAAMIDFSKARILRVATTVVRQGHEPEFEEAMKSLAAAYEKVNADSPWVLYQVNAGAPSTTFVFFMPMHSMQDMDDYVARGKALSQAEGTAVEARMRQAAREAYKSWDSELFFISPRQSHVPTEFAAGDPEFWAH